MKKTFIWVSILLLGLTISSCVTVPEKTSSDDCLVIIPTEMIKDKGAEQARSYFLQITGQSKDFKVSSARYGKIQFVSSVQDAKIEVITSRITNPKYKGPDSSHETNQPLPYEKGKLIINDFKIVQSITKTKANSYQSKYDFVPLSEDEKKQFLAKYMADPDYSSWF